MAKPYILNTTDLPNENPFIASNVFIKIRYFASKNTFLMFVLLMIKDFSLKDCQYF